MRASGRESCLLTFLAPGVGANKANASRIQVYQAQLDLVKSAVQANKLMLMLNK